MTLLKTSLLASLLVFGFSIQAQEVYKSTDSEGNVTFSDQPGDSSDKVTIPETNVGDSVDVPPPAPAEPVDAPQGEIFEGLPKNLEGEIEAVKKRSKKNRRPRKEPRGGR